MGMPDREYIEQFSRRNMPLVVADHVAEGVALDYVACDNEGSMRAVVEHLAGLGHRRFAYLDIALRISRDSDCIERREAFRRQVEAAGGEAVAQAEHWGSSPGNDGKMPESYAALLEKLAGRDADRPTAVITDSEGSASALMIVLNKRELRVPEDVSVAAVSQTKGDIPIPYPVTGCFTDFYGMGVKAMELLELRCRRPRPDGPHVVRVGFEFEPGKTAGPPPGT